MAPVPFLLYITEAVEGPKIWAKNNRFSIFASASVLFSISANSGGRGYSPPDPPTSGPPRLEAAEPKI